MLQRITILLGLIFLSACEERIDGILSITHDSGQDTILLSKNSFKNQQGELFGTLESVDSNNHLIYQLDWLKQDNFIELTLTEKNNRVFTFVVEEGVAKDLITLNDLRLKYEVRKSS